MKKMYLLSITGTCHCNASKVLDVCDFLWNVNDVFYAYDVRYCDIHKIYFVLEDCSPSWLK